MRAWSLMRRLVLLVALLVVPWLGASRQAAGAPAHGLTLLVDPASVPPGQPADLTVRLLDAVARPVSGASLRISGGTVAGTLPTTGNTPLHLRLTPTGSGPITIQATHSDFTAVSVQVPVIAPRVPARVAALNPSLGILPDGVSLFRAARQQDPLFFLWRARTTATQRGSLRFADGSVMDMDINTELLIKSPTRTFLQTGQVFVQVVSGGQSHDLETGTAVAASMGTRYQMRVVGGRTTVTVYSGRLSWRSAGQTVALGAGQQSSYTAGAAPGTPSTAALRGAPAWTAGLPVAAGAGGPTYAYLLRNGGAQLDVFAIETWKVVRSVPLSLPGRDLALSGDGQDLFIATAGGVVDVPLPNGAARTLRGGIQATALATLPNHQLAVADAGSGALVLLDAQTGDTLRSIPLGYAPTGLAASPDGTLAVVDGEGEASLVDLSAGQVLTTREAPGGTGQPTFASNGQIAYVPVPVRSIILELSVASRGPVGTIALPSTGAVSELNASVGYGDGRVFVANARAGTIDVVDPVSNTLLTRYALGAQPLRIALAPDGKLAVTTRAPSKLILLDPWDGAILETASLANPDLSPPLLLSRPGIPADAPVWSKVYAEQIASSVTGTEQIQTKPSQPSAGPSATATVPATATDTPTATLTSTPLPAATLPSYPTYPAPPTATSSVSSPPTQPPTPRPTPTRPKQRLP